MIDEPMNEELQAEISASVQEEQSKELQEISELSKHGYQYLKENRVEEAEECFSRILEKDRENNYALVGLGDAARKRGAFRDAVEHYRKCLTHHPGNNYALFGLADCYKALNQYQKAIEIWEQYLIHDDHNITVLTRVADAYRKVRDFKKSKVIYLKVLEMEENNAYALIGLGHLHYDFKEYKDALFFWGKILELHGDNVDIRVLTSMGNCHRKMKTFAEGIPLFERALKIDPDNFYALFGLADCYRGLGMQYRSLEYWNRILEKDPHNKVILTRAGDAYRNMGEYDNANDYYTRALNIEYDVYAVLGLATIAKLQEKYLDAVASLSKLLQNDQRNYRLYLEIADCYIRANEKEKALETLVQFQQFGIRNPAISEMIERLK
jgi:tetratricopeptide (TPR) repeat protein